MSTKSIRSRLGPGLITASVVLGPGSIVASSRAGAETGYALLWVLVAAGVLMAVYVSMGARLGCALGTTPLQYVARRFGRWLAVLAGLSAFLVCGGFQFGNNLGVAFAVSSITQTPPYLWPPVFTLFALAFLFGAKRVYLMLERVMMVLVAIMILAFFANLLFTGIHPVHLLSGLAPDIPKGQGLIARAMLATTFSVVAAFYQAYLVQAKGWKKADLKDAIVDAWLGIAILAAISAAILIGAAEVLYGTGETFKNVGQLAAILGNILGPAANVVFCLGLGAAAFSSFIVNAMVGGTMFADGLGLDARLDGKATRGFTAVIMVMGCVVGVLAVGPGKGTTQSLLIAQASTLVAVPLCAVLLFLLTSQEKTMHGLKNGRGALALGAAGLCVILYLSGNVMAGLFGFG